MSTCGAPTKYRPPRPCRRRVRDDAVRCYQHGKGVVPHQRPLYTPPGGIPIIQRQSEPEPARVPPRRSKLTKEEQERVEKTAEFVSDVVVDRWKSAVAEQAKTLLGDDKTWNRLFGRHRNRDCKALARAAKQLLDVKKALHQALGDGATAIVKQSGGGSVEQAMASALAMKIPIPGEEQVVLVARGLQIVGIAICLHARRPLTRCQCFIDLALSETKERVKTILEGELDALTKPGERVSTDLPRSPARRTLV
jgi:hypothetical protein